jgi:hypothetical protein
LLRNSSPPLQYESHPFKKTTFKINEVGEATRVNSNEVETILVAQDWQLHRKGSVPRDGYIAKGYSKYAFRVCTDSLHRNPYTDPRITEQGRIGTTTYALVQSKPIMSSESMNNTDLINELGLLHLGQYFMETFYARAAFFKVKALPRKLCGALWLLVC